LCLEVYKISDSR